MVAALSVGTMICAGAISWRIKMGGYAFKGEICNNLRNESLLWTCTI